MADPIEMLWRHFRREVTHGELFESIDAVLEATREFFARCNRAPQCTRALIGAHPTCLTPTYLAVGGRQKIPFGWLPPAAARNSITKVRVILTRVLSDTQGGRTR